LSTFHWTSMQVFVCEVVGTSAIAVHKNCIFSGLRMA
jgi:hypothetical protein